jgi:DNA gyrase subunit B
MKVEAALQWTDSAGENVLTFANGAFTRLGGTHLTGFRAGLTEALHEHLRAQAPDASDLPDGEECRRGLSAVVAVIVQDPWLARATTDRLNNAEVEGFVAGHVRRHLADFLRAHPADAKAIAAAVRAARGAGPADPKTGMS